MPVICAGRLFFFQLGPRQEFVAQSRSTRDLWSGSYLLSWMTGQVLHRVRDGDKSKGIHVLFPSLADGDCPMLDWIARKQRGADQAKAATLPTLPNRFLALVPNSFNDATVRAILREVFEYRAGRTNVGEPTSEWERICDACRFWFEDPDRTPSLFQARGPGDPQTLRRLWDHQLGRFWQPNWLLWPDPSSPARDYAQELALFRATPVGQRWARAHPNGDPGPWMVRYHLALHRFDGRRQTRDFAPWEGSPGFDKDSLSGREEAIADTVWLEAIPRSRAGKRIDLNHLFRKEDPLGAPNLVKRVWHKAYLEAPEPGGAGLNKRTLESGAMAHGSYFDIPSVPGVAVFPWARELWARHEKPEFRDFVEAVARVEKDLDFEFPKWTELDRRSPRDWLGRVDWEIFRDRFWVERKQAALRAHREAREPEDRLRAERQERAADAGAQALRHLRLANPDLPAPSSYYAVLAGDGDALGRWLSGEAPNEALFALTEEFHRNLSQGIAAFSSRNSRLTRAIEDLSTKFGSEHPFEFQGKIVYAGGEDVLALLPAEQAVDCALALRRGYVEAMQIPGRPPNTEFTYSVGIAIGHVKEPLQDMVQAAHDAEKRAKGKTFAEVWDAQEQRTVCRIAEGLGRNALAVTLFKRSGETIRWGARFDSAAFPLLAAFRQGYRFRISEPTWVPSISGRFPHRLIEIVSRYGGRTVMTETLAGIVKADFAYVVEQQARDLSRDARDDLVEKAGAYLGELARFPGSADQSGCPRGRCLEDFYHLFAMEAFIAGRGE